MLDAQGSRMRRWSQTSHDMCMRCQLWSNQRTPTPALKEQESSVHAHYKSEWAAPLNAPEDVLREAFKDELVSLYGLEEASVRFVLDPLKIAMYEYDNELIPIDTDPHDE